MCSPQSHSVPLRDRARRSPARHRQPCPPPRLALWPPPQQSVTQHNTRQRSTTHQQCHLQCQEVAFVSDSECAVKKSRASPTPSVKFLTQHRPAWLLVWLFCHRGGGMWLCHVSNWARRERRWGWGTYFITSCALRALQWSLGKPPQISHVPHAGEYEHGCPLRRLLVHVKRPHPLAQHVIPELQTLALACDAKVRCWGRSIIHVFTTGNRTRSNVGSHFKQTAEKRFLAHSPIVQARERRNFLHPCQIFLNGFFVPLRSERITPQRKRPRVALTWGKRRGGHSGFAGRHLIGRFQVVIVSGVCIGRVVCAGPGVGCGRLTGTSDPVKVIVCQLIPVTVSLLKVTQVCIGINHTKTTPFHYIKSWPTIAWLFVTWGNGGLLIKWHHLSCNR